MYNTCTGNLEKSFSNKEILEICSIWYSRAIFKYRPQIQLAQALLSPRLSSKRSKKKSLRSKRKRKKISPKLKLQLSLQRNREDIKLR